MIKIGDTLTLDKLISRALIEDAFIVLRHHGSLLSAIYRIADSIHAELWMIVTEAPEPNLMHFAAYCDVSNATTSTDIRIE